MPKIGDTYRDDAGRKFTLLQRMDPMGVETPAYWRVQTEGNGHQSTIRENRLHEYESIDAKDDND